MRRVNALFMLRCYAVLGVLERHYRVSVVIVILPVIHVIRCVY